MNNKILLAVGVGLLLMGLFKTNVVSDPVVDNAVETYVVDAPSDLDLLEKSYKIIGLMKSFDDSTKASDCKKLSALYADLSTLISLDQQDEVIKDTNTIRNANSLAGTMLRLDIKNKYPDLAQANEELVVSAIGNDDTVLDEALRSKAVDAFRALSWAFYESSQ